MKRLIGVRRAHPVFGRGTLEFLHPENRRVLAYLREHEGVTVMCVANLSRFAQYVELDLSRFGGRVPVELIGRVQFPRIGELPYLLTLGPHDFFWFELTDGELRPARVTAAFEPCWLAAQRWFRSKQRSIAAVTEVDGASVGPAALRVLEAPSRRRCRRPLPGADGRWPRAGGRRRRLTAIVRAIGGRAEVRGSRGGFTCSRTACFTGCCHRRSDRRRARRATPAGRAVEHVGRAGDRLILKLYRLLEPGVNPDLEVSAFLTDVGFADTPAVAGAVT